MWHVNRGNVKTNEMLRASALSNLGVAHGRMGAAAKGLPFAREGYEIRARLAPLDPNTHNTGWQLGISYMENSQLDLAVEIMERTYAASVEASGADHPDVVAGVVLLHYAKARRGDGAEVIQPMREAIETQRRIGIPQQQIAQSRMYLAGALLYAGDRDLAVREADAVLAEIVSTSPACGRNVVTLLLQVGTMFSVAGAQPEALTYLERAFACSQENAESAPFARRIAGSIVWVYRRMDDEQNALRWREIENGLKP